MSITDVLKNAIKDSEETRYRISKATGVDQRTLGRFINNEVSPTGTKLDALATHFGLVLVPESAVKKPKPSSSKKR